MKAGHVFTIEPMINEGMWQVRFKSMITFELLLTLIIIKRINSGQMIGQV